MSASSAHPVAPPASMTAWTPLPDATLTGALPPDLALPDTLAADAFHTEPAPSLPDSALALAHPPSLWRTASDLNLSAFAPAPESVRKTADIMNEFKHIAIDARGVRNGNGDTAAGYLFALNLVADWDFKGRISFIADEPVLKIVRTLTGQNVKAGDTICDGRVRLLRPGLWSYLRSFWEPKADLYVSLARPCGTVDNLTEAKFLRHSNRSGAPIQRWKLPLRTHENAVFVVQKVFGKSENLNPLHPHGMIRRGATDAEMSAPGPGANESGIYRDPVAWKLRGKSRAELKDCVNAELAAVADAELRATLSGLVNGTILSGAKFAFAYGLSMEIIGTQVAAYLRGMKASMDKKDSLVVVTPSRRPPVFYAGLADAGVTLVDDFAALPAKAEPGKIYVLQIKNIPHRLFNGLLAFSEYPAVVSGNSALSAAIAIGKPFGMTSVGWNHSEAMSLRGLLAQADPARASLYTAVLSPKPELQHLGKFSSPEIAAAFFGLAEKTGDFAENLARAIDEVKTHRRRPVEPAPHAADLADPALRASLLLDAARRGDRRALRHFAWECKRDLRILFLAARRNLIPANVMNHSRFQSAVRAHLANTAKLSRSERWELEEMLVRKGAKTSRWARWRKYFTSFFS